MSNPRIPSSARSLPICSFRPAAASAVLAIALSSVASGQVLSTAAANTSAVAPGVLIPASSQAAGLGSQPILAELRPPSLAAPEALPDAPAAANGISSSSLLLSSALPPDPAADETNAGRKYAKAASPTDITVLPGQTAPHQSVRDKLVGSVRDAVSPFTLGGELISAGYSHATNGSPNYGTDAPAFAQRFGASVARGTSQNLFHEGAMAAILHEDPRYYQMGSGHPFFKRLVYAGTRPLITRTDGGKSTPNLALLSGYLGAAALTKVYYPPLNQGFNQTLQTYGGSIGGAAIGYVVTEFLSDALQIVHLKKSE